MMVAMAADGGVADEGFDGIMRIGPGSLGPFSMDDDLDALFARLAEQPLPRRLNALEAGVGRSLGSAHATVAAPLRYAAVGLALVAGLGVGGSAAVLRQRPALAADLSGGAGFAPSSLLDATS